MAKMDPALPAVLYERFRRTFTTEEWIKEHYERPHFEYDLTIKTGMPTWNALKPGARERWEAVAREAVRFVTEEEVSP